jgi:hypothetical protein
LRSLLLSNLNLALFEDLQDDLITGQPGKGFFQVVVGSDLSFGDVDKDILNLEDIIEVGFVAGTKGCDGVFVTCDFEPFLACDFLSVRALKVGCFGAMQYLSSYGQG